MPSHSAPGSNASLRTANQQRVLDVLRGAPAVSPDDQEPLTQAYLARITGLAPATVSNIVRQLSSAGLLDTVKGSGRRGTTVRLARSAGLVAGLDFGHSHVAVALGDLTGAILDDIREPLDVGQSHDEGLSQARRLLDRLCERSDTPPGDVRSIGLGLPAPMTDGVVRSSAILPGWVGVHARDAAQESFGKAVHVENDANLGALAEHRFGVAQGHSTSVFVKISSGVGAGVIVNDDIFRGASGTAGEIGHLTLDEQGPLCRCGSRGCLEAYASIGTVQSMVAGQLPDATLDEIVRAARAGNVSALRSFEDAGLHLGWALASVVNLLNPALIVVGGDMARAGDLLLDSVRIGLRRHALDAVAATPVVISELGQQASLIGAILLAAERTEIVPD